MSKSKLEAQCGFVTHDDVNKLMADRDRLRAALEKLVLLAEEASISEDIEVARDAIQRAKEW